MENIETEKGLSTRSYSICVCIYVRGGRRGRRSMVVVVVAVVVVVVVLGFEGRDEELKMVKSNAVVV